MLTAHAKKAVQPIAALALKLLYPVRAYANAKIAKMEISQRTMSMAVTLTVAPRVTRKAIVIDVSLIISNKSFSLTFTGKR